MFEKPKGPQIFYFLSLFPYQHFTLFDKVIEFTRALCSFCHLNYTVTRLTQECM